MSEAPAGGDDAPGERRTSTPDAAALARVVFALLVIACFAAFFITQRLKHTPTVLQRFERTPSFSPSSPPPHNLEEISFKLASADEVTVAIVDSRGNVVATLAHDHPVGRYKQFSLRWNGRRGAPHRYAALQTSSGRAVLLPLTEGPPAPPGEYRVRVILRSQERTILSPWSFALVGR